MAGRAITFTDQREALVLGVFRVLLSTRNLHRFLHYVLVVPLERRRRFLHDHHRVASHDDECIWRYPETLRCKLVHVLLKVRRDRSVLQRVLELRRRRVSPDQGRVRRMHSGDRQPRQSVSGRRKFIQLFLRARPVLVRNGHPRRYWCRRDRRRVRRCGYRITRGARQRHPKVLHELHLVHYLPSIILQRVFGLTP